MNNSLRQHLQKADIAALCVRIDAENIPGRVPASENSALYQALTLSGDEAVVSRASDKAAELITNPSPSDYTVARALLVMSYQQSSGAPYADEALVRSGSKLARHDGHDLVAERLNQFCLDVRRLAPPERASDILLQIEGTAGSHNIPGKNHSVLAAHMGDCLTAEQMHGHGERYAQMFGATNPQMGD
jgi:hypothetical protein